MKYAIVGIKAMEGTSKKTGKPFDCYLLHVNYESTGDVDAGIACRQLFLDKKMLSNAVQQFGGYRALVGTEIDVQYNDRGFPVGCEVL